MAIKCICGLPGEGKSMVSTDMMLRYLHRTKLTVVTNLPLIPGAIWYQLKQKYGMDLDQSRYQQLDEHQVKKFYLHRGQGWVAPMPKERKEGGDGRIDYAHCRRTVEKEPGVFVEETIAGNKLPGVVYILDEAHLHYGARNWAEMAESAMFYLSQHRHLGDQVFMVTQHPKQLDVSIRNLTAEYLKVTNYGNRVPWGVKLPDVFEVRRYNAPPGLLVPCQGTKALRLDVEGLGSCYDTAGGVGMDGGLADTADRPKGRPWWLVAGVGLLVLWGLLQVPQMLVGKTASVLDAPKPQATNSAPIKPAAPVPIAPPVPQPIRYVQAGPPMTNAAKINVMPPTVQLEPLRVKWMVRKVDSVSLGMSNGDAFTVGDGRLQLVGKFAVLDGSKVFRLPD